MGQPAEGERKPRLLVVGLDAADRELIERWCAEGSLPNLSRMRAKGTWGSLHTTADTVHVSAWPGIFSGTTPDKHGLYHAYVMRPGEQAPVRPRPDECPVPFVWKLLDEHGVRSIVVDAFLTCPLRDFSGIQIVDWGSWTWFSGQEIRPDSVKQAIRSRFGAYPAENHSSVGMTPPSDPLGFRRRLLQGVEKKSEVAQWLMESHDWEFFLLVFGECHAAGHYFWHYMDPDYVAHPQQAADELRGALRDVYVALDRAVGELLARCDDRTTVYVVSGDGMGPNYSGSHLLNALLERMRLINAGREPKGARPAKAKKSLSSTLRGLVPKDLRALISKHVLPRALNEKLSMHWKTADISWNSTRAFVIENANEGYVRVNLKGREPEGIVAQEGEYDAICDELLDVVGSMTNPANGRRAAERVERTSRLYSGPCACNFPDVIINWDPDAKVTNALATSRYGVVETEQAGFEVTPYYTGNHRGNAFIIAQGPTVPVGGVLEGASILDLAPTILKHFGVAVPEHMDGKIQESLG